MKKLLTFALALGLAACLAWLIRDSWLTVSRFQADGREAELKIGPRYNASRWAEPLPIKKLHTYKAVMAEKYEVLVETDQELAENSRVFIRFVLRDRADEIRSLGFRPVANAIRLRVNEDGSPVKIADTDPFDRLVDRAMGDPGPLVHRSEAPKAEAAPDHGRATVPFVIGGSKESVPELIWNNSTVGEWLIVGFGLLLLQAIAIHAWTMPWHNGPSRADRKDFVHPSLRHIEPDAPKSAAPTKLTYVPKPEVEIALPVTRPTPPPAPAPAAPAAAPAEDDSATQSLLARETAAPFPQADTTPTLSLRRKKADRPTDSDPASSA